MMYMATKGNGGAAQTGTASSSATPATGSAAPAAPSTNAPNPAVAAPVPGSNAPAPQGGQGEGQAASSPAPSSAPKRIASGIPGVSVDVAGEEYLGGDAHPQEEGFRRILSQDPDSAPPLDTGSGQEGEGEGGDPKTQEAVPPPAPKFKIGDVEFDSEEVAAHTIKSLRGQAQAVDRRHRELSQQQQTIINALAQAGLTLQADGTVARAANAPAPAPAANTLPATPSPRTPPPAPADVDLSTAEGVQSILDSALDWKQLPNLIKFYEEKHGQSLGPAVAMRLVMEAVVPKLAGAIHAQSEKLVAPLQNMAHSVQASTAVRDLFVGMKDFSFEDGTPAYPEFTTDEGVSEVYQAWLGLGEKGFPPKFMMSHEGVHLAISLLRDYKNMLARTPQGQRQPNAVVPSNPPPSQVPNVQAATDAVRGVMESIERARGSVGGDLASGQGQPFRPSGASEDAVARVKRAIAGAQGKEVIPGVHFS